MNLIVTVVIIIIFFSFIVSFSRYILFLSQDTYHMKCSGLLIKRFFSIGKQSFFSIKIISASLYFIFCDYYAIILVKLYFSMH